MPYAFSTLPSTQHAKKFKVIDRKSKSEAYFTIKKEMLGFWGNPQEGKIEQFMIAYLKKNGWPKEPVEISVENTPKNLGAHIHSLMNPGKKK